jgi:hypothetical protein
MSGSNRPKNALSHGVYASDVVLPWEREEDFERLHQNLRGEFCPDGASEEEAVFEIATLYWKKRRLNVGSQLAFHGHPDAAALAEAGRNGWSGIAHYLKSSVGNGDRMCDAIRTMARSHAVTFSKVCALMDERLEQMWAGNKSAGQEGQSSDRESKQSESAELQNLIHFGQRTERHDRPDPGPAPPDRDLRPRPKGLRTRLSAGDHGAGA